MTRILIAPSKYIQGSGAIHEIGKYASNLGSKVLVTGGKRALLAAQGAIEGSLGKAGVGVMVEGFRDECSQNEIKRLTEVVKDANGETVLRHLAEFAQEGGTVLLVTHDQKAANHATHTVNMDAGKLA